jgi:transcriptional regulator GlxA family with amidase domain
MRVYISIFPKPQALPNSPVFFRWQGPPFDGHFAEMIAALNAANTFLYARADEPNEVRRDLAHQIKISIDRTFEQDCLLTRLADELCISPAHLSRVFKKRYGLTAVDYRSKLRSVWAVQQLIRNEQRNISDIAFEVGYNDLSRFNKQFRRHLRMAPGALKKLCDK